MPLLSIRDVNFADACAAPGSSWHRAGKHFWPGGASASGVGSSSSPGGRREWGRTPGSRGAPRGSACDIPGDPDGYWGGACRLRPRQETHGHGASWALGGDRPGQHLLAAVLDYFHRPERRHPLSAAGRPQHWLWPRPRLHHRLQAPRSSMVTSGGSGTSLRPSPHATLGVLIFAIASVLRGLAARRCLIVARGCGAAAAGPRCSASSAAITAGAGPHAFNATAWHLVYCQRPQFG